MKTASSIMRILILMFAPGFMIVSSLSGQGTCIARIDDGDPYYLVTDPSIDVINYGFVRLRAKILYDGAGNFAFQLKAPDSVQAYLSVTDHSYNGPFIIGGWVGSHICIDDLRVRKFARNEPSYEIGDEETPPPLAAWFDPDWGMRRPIFIDNSSSSDSLFDFQVKMDIPYDADMQQDFDDIRFTSDDSISPIPYWKAECYPGNRAVVYARVPLIPGGDTTHIFMYYGNPSATSESNGYSVFEYFDDFADADISDWSILGGSWTASNRFLEQLLTANHRRILGPYQNLGAAIIEATMAYLSTYPYAGNHIFLATDYNGSNGYYFGFDGPAAGKEIEADGNVKQVSLTLLSSVPGAQIRLLLHIPEPLIVNGSIYDCAGRGVLTFLDGRLLSAGKHTIGLDVERLPASIYIVSIAVHDAQDPVGGKSFLLREKILLLK